MVQVYIKTLSTQACTVSTNLATATAKAFRQRYPDVICNIYIDSSSWPKRFFERMSFVGRMKISLKVKVMIEQQRRNKEGIGVLAPSWNCDDDRKTQNWGNNLCVVNVPANVTCFHQPWDETLNKYCKKFLKKKFINWYVGQLSK